jgi:signal peptidase I
MRRRGEEEEPDDDEEPEENPSSDPDEAEPDEQEQRPPPRRRSTSSRRHSASRPVRPWTIDDLDTEEDEVPSDESDSEKNAGGFFHRLRSPVFFRARDSWYFEPLVALAIIVLLLVCLFAYTSNWPPIYVVESSSMEHGTGDIVGLINAGDLVLIQKISPGSILPYVAGEGTGYMTYGEYGDVILYHPNGNTLATPVIHRAILYLIWNPSNRTYSAPALANLPCGSEPGALYSISGTPNGCGSTGLISSITLYHVGWKDATVVIPLGAIWPYSGFITMGDNNLDYNVPPGSPPQGEIDQESGISGLVAPSWIVGAARGMLPWVGSFKLLIDGNTQYVPPQSWQFLALTISAVVLAGFGIHYLFRVEGIEDPRRLEEEREQEREPAAEEEDGPQWKDHPRGGRWKGLRAWLAAPEEEDERSTPPRKHSRTIHRSAPVPKPASKARARGRPRPAVRKSKGIFHRRSEARSSRDSDDDTL